MAIDETHPSDETRACMPPQGRAWQLWAARHCQGARAMFPGYHPSSDPAGRAAAHRPPRQPQGGLGCPVAGVAAEAGEGGAYHHSNPDPNPNPTPTPTPSPSPSPSPTPTPNSRPTPNPTPDPNPNPEQAAADARSAARAKEIAEEAGGEEEAEGREATGEDQYPEGLPSAR
eukprot:scaffold66719_cov51-Phaeocystis_antarctica.AAC.1